MKRGRIIDISNCCVHITQRCHDGDFLLKFEIDRKNYIKRLGETVRRFNIAVLDYMITCNHVHLLLRSDDINKISAAMQYLQGLTARDYNRRKGRSGSFWSDRFNPTLVENGVHLSRCLYYIGLNMVRAGVVAHPQDWTASGYDEITGQRQRYRVLNLPALLESLGMPRRITDFRTWYRQTIDQMSLSNNLYREEHWTNAVAVGSKAWLESISDTLSEADKSFGRVQNERNDIIKEDGGTYALNAKNGVLNR